MMTIILRPSKLKKTNTQSVYKRFEAMVISDYLSDFRRLACSSRAITTRWIVPGSPWLNSPLALVHSQLSNFHFKQRKQ